jgi:exodeoxyribonuclease VIII
VILVDAKTYSDASPREFARQVARKGYHRQAAWYSDGYALASGEPVLGFVFVAVETAWPYASCAVMLDDEGLAKGRAENTELLARFAECRTANSWPGYSNEIEQITLPKWAA